MTCGPRSWSSPTASARSMHAAVVDQPGLDVEQRLAHRAWLGAGQLARAARSCSARPRSGRSRGGTPTPRAKNDSNRRAGPGAPPLMTSRRRDISVPPQRACWSSMTNIVGTPNKSVASPPATRSRTCSGIEAPADDRGAAGVKQRRGAHVQPAGVKERRVDRWPCRRRPGPSSRPCRSRSTGCRRGSAPRRAACRSSRPCSTAPRDRRSMAELADSPVRRAHLLPRLERVRQAGGGVHAAGGTPVIWRPGPCRRARPRSSPAPARSA